ncbi:MAG TPA: PAS domain S-box protein [Bryobacteraceae bacterium]|nr:PAS domain S-box protein [Bryobacteraceae bacterium]
MPQRTAMLFGAISALTGLLALTGWAAHLPRLAQVSPDLPAMPWTDALCCVLLGPVLMSIASAQSRWTPLGCALVAFVAAASLAERAMSPATALAMLVAAAGLFLAQTGSESQRSWLLGIASMALLAISASCGVGTVWGGGDAFGFGALTAMAFHTSVALMLLGIGSFVIAVDASLAELQLPHWAPIGAGLFLVVVRFGLLDTFAPRHRTSASMPLAIIGALLGAIAFGTFVHLALKTYLQRELLRNANRLLANEMAERERAEGQAQVANERLERRVEERTRSLEEVNEELRKQKEILQTIFDHVPQAIDFIDQDDRVHMVNRAWEHLVGHKLSEIAGKSVNFLAEDSFPDPAERQRAIDFVAKSTSEWADFEFRAADGHIRHTSWSVIRLSDGSRIGIGQDITQRKAAESELLRQKEILQTIFDHIPVLINFGDADNKAVLANREWEQTLGWSLEEINREGIDILAENYPDPEYRQKVREFVVNCSGEWRDFKTRVRDGRVIDTSWAMLKLPDGTTIGIGQDITARKQAEEALRESEERFRQLTENIQDLFWIKTPDLKRVIYMSPIFQRLSGRAPEEIYGDTDYHEFLKQIVPEDREIMADIIGRQMSEFDVEYRIGEGNGNFRWVRDRGFPIRDESGQIYRIAGITTDITDRKLAEEALRESEERFRQLTENIHEVFWLRSPDFKQLLYVSPRYQEVCGKSTEAAYSTAVDLGVVFPDDRERVAETMENFSGEEFEIEYRIRDKDGALRWIRDRGFPIRNQAGEIYRVGGVAEDITERKKAEEYLNASREQLRALSAGLQSAREEEATRIAHQIHDDMGGVLTALRWELEALGKMIHDTGVPSTLQPAIDSKLTAMLGLTDTTINVVRRIASELRPSILDDLGLPEAIEWQAQQFQIRTGIECRCDFGASVNNLGERQSTAIFRIFQEALTNILRHAYATHVDVATKEEGRSFLLAVSDNGRGITEEEKLGRGSLGILGMQERARLIGGQVDLVGSAGMGTTVFVRIPLEDSGSAN